MLILFGSRVDLEQRGGDLDLFIQTSLDDSSIARRKFILELHDKIGYQKIDVVIKNINNPDFDLAIYKIAKETGIRLA